MHTSRQPLPAESDLSQPVTRREMLLTAAAGVLVAAVAEDGAVTIIGSIAAAVALGVATWMAYRAEEARKAALSQQERDDEWDREQW